ncbi:MAG: alpha/beta hydrolase [Chloroflexi bacterium]|uniref:Alpha/beta hydrolase n=1 Tax=Candidatus Chlorohelix allophototropha TaxID=3003348 RepID=A0A8T7M7W1_9CHLR|nr:alpha/beta hydrolase [Chloroflexota bacterium]WJW68156.1 alpha/beta hydrolase [Chloroflexota bacterium L227-S17]
MSEINFLPGINYQCISTDRLEVAYLEAGEVNKTPVVLIHGNVSCNLFFEDLMLVLANSGEYHVYAPDMRGYGKTQTLPVDATRGMKDYSDDLFSFVTALNLPPFHLLGWSLGGNVVMEYAIHHADTLRSLTLEAASSPFGFGGCQGLDGKPHFADFAGSGGGTANPDFVARLKNQDRSDEAPNSPRNVMNTYYFKPPFKVAPDIEENYVTAMLSTYVADGNYPGDLTTSENWPTVAPGTLGVNNALSPKYMNQSSFANISIKPDVLWIRGDSDQIVADNSLFDFGTLGMLGAVPGWPGMEIYPPQPMVSQLRSVLDTYKDNGGSYEEIVLADCGHSPHVEKPEEFGTKLLDFLRLH